MTGFLNLFKPEGMSSAQAVNKVKWLRLKLRAKKLPA